MDAVSLLAAPFAMCLVLLGIHCYLGLHVLARGVVFVDLSLAQVSVLGAAFGVWMGLEAGGLGGYGLALAATLLASLFFAAARRLEGKVSQEALIGIVYALASAAIVLVLDRTLHGTEVLKEALVGQILWVSWADVVKTLGIYILVGAVHYTFRSSQIRSSFGERTSWRDDLLFYVTFSVVITSSTQYAGVLLVFSMLIVPAVLATLYFKTLRSQLIFGWSFGAICSLLGLMGSYYLDVPSGAFIVVLFCLVPLPLVLLKALKKVEGAPALKGD